MITDYITIKFPDGSMKSFVKRPVAESTPKRKSVQDLRPGDWWVQQYPEYVCSYVFLRKLPEKEYQVLITRDDGKIWLSVMYEVDS